jgi:hypothetical protein
MNDFNFAHRSSGSVVESNMYHQLIMPFDDRVLCDPERGDEGAGSLNIMWDLLAHIGLYQSQYRICI